MERKRFEHLVSKAFDDLPDEFLEQLENIEVIVEDIPSPRQVKKLRLKDPLELMGLYEGTPQTVRTTNYGLVPPDKITLFQQSIESRCRSDKEIEAEIKITLQHEIAHYFGLEDAELYKIERQKRKMTRRKRS
jgi:predicted Zn-dependent protease with MMP-like domain